MGRISGLIYIKVDGQQYRAKGNFTYNLGKPKREAVVGADGVHGYKELPKAPFIEGEISDEATLNLAALQDITDATVTLELPNGKTIVLRKAFYAADGDGQTEESNIQLRFEGETCEEIAA